MAKNKVLIIRFSSFGDIVQCSTVVEAITQRFNSVEIDWLTRAEFSELVMLNKNINKVIPFERKSGIIGLVKLAIQLRNFNYDYVYDAHNNLRSNILYLFFKITFSKSNWLSRSKDRFKRILLFKFKINYFPNPFKGIDSYLKPISGIGNQFSNVGNHSMVNYEFNSDTINKVLEKIIANKKVITLVPSAAWEMKRWPMNHWINLIKISPEFQFYILGGASDTFCEEIRNASSTNVVNLSGAFSLIESACFIKKSDVVISADTGLLHIADVLGIKSISLMGPTAFGFTKSELIKTLEVNLDCRPCSKDGRGHCTQKVYQKCMVDISPELVYETLKSLTN